MTTTPKTTPTTTTTVVATVEAVEAVRNVVLPARDARLPKEAANLQDCVIPSPLGRSSDGDDAARLGHSDVSEALSQEVMPADDQSSSKKRKKKSKRAKTKPVAKNRELRSGRSSDGDDAARLGHAEVSEVLSQEVTPDTNQSPSKKRKKKSTPAKKERKAKNQNLDSSSTLGRSSYGDDVPKRRHSDVPVQEVTPADDQSSSKKRKKKTRRSEKKNKVKNQDLRSGRSSYGDDVPKRGRSEVSEAPVQELAPVKEQNSSVQHHENLTQSESLDTKSSPDKKKPEKDRKRLKIFKKIKKRFKRFGKQIRKKVEKELLKEFSSFLVKVICLQLSMVVPFLSNGITTSGYPIEQQGQVQVNNIMYCPASESASPVAITPKQPDLRADSNSTQIYCVCCIVQQ